MTRGTSPPLGAPARLRLQWMANPNHLRGGSIRRWLGACLVCLLIVPPDWAARAQAQTQAEPLAQPQNAEAQQTPTSGTTGNGATGSNPQAATGPDATATTGPDAKVAGASRIAEATPTRRQARAAEDAYLAGAKRLERDDLTGAEHEFARALQLDPGNHEYAIAISVAREHRLTALVQQAGKARMAGDHAGADALAGGGACDRPVEPDRYATPRPGPENLCERYHAAGLGFTALQRERRRSDNDTSHRQDAIALSG